ncbi:Uncharacterized conserved protein YkwD, contains CAP (CSP/antigen 5/PR1) domain [Micromonospora nigra]|uniref:Uncharacterized conserved protein YkwD, contains CAP (CSP/antigen 5/PR1) domain n=1 Tax=Micromonospora nigra TaxID=145857 RepID=A0A1C6SLK2_9ACTN|nr:CAP domain-containing protein [Micromonospora nigra]SCL30079.1 Uncharacterized conserved protein YkwD, contains CAP (CSP/antigen 5/PR1) domain [Micromonospora nigra]
MYGWTDPFDPAASRHPEQPAGEDPEWLTDRPAPRSSYLFGDEPDRPADQWHRDEPTARWQPDDRPTDQWRADEQRWPADDRATAQWTADEQAASRWHGAGRADTTGHRSSGSEHAPYHPDGHAGHGQDPYPVAGQAPHPADGPDARDTGWYPAERHPDPYPGGDGRFEQAAGAWPAEDPTAPVELPAHHAPAATTPIRRAGRAGAGRRADRRLSRPVVLGGAAAAATLVVSLGVAALALPGGDDGHTAPTAGDEPIAVVEGPTGPQESPLDALATPTPSASPSTASPSPSPSPSKKAKPAPSRTTAPSRQSTERSKAPSASPTRTGVAGAGTGGQAAEVVKLANAERAKAGCDPLSIDDKLTTAAQRHSQDQADHRNMSHTGSDGSNPGDRIERVGYQWRTYGENVAWNQKTPEAVMAAWMNSDGHRANILNCSFTEIGVGVANSNGPYWTQVFATPR